MVAPCFVGEGHAFLGMSFSYFSSSRYLYIRIYSSFPSYWKGTMHSLCETDLGRDLHPVGSSHRMEAPWIDGVAIGCHVEQKTSRDATIRCGSIDEHIQHLQNSLFKVPRSFARELLSQTASTRLQSLNGERPLLISSFS